jgi:tryptophan synthase beta chain
VLLHQTILGLEAHKQLASINEYPDIVVGCAGGGSNFAGLALPFVRDKIHGKELRIIASEPASCPTMTKGPYAYDFGDTAETTPLLPMYSLGHAFIPAPIHAGGLRYHGMAPIVSRLLKDNLIEATACRQLDTFAAGIEKVILMNWSGHGIIDLAAYDAYLAGKLDNYVLPDDEIKTLVKDLEKFPKP